MARNLRKAGTISPQKSDAFPVLSFMMVAIFRTASRFLKNFVRRLLGRQPYVDERGLFLRQAILHLLGSRPIRALTCVRPMSGDGAGSQAHKIVNAMAVARLAGLTYVHTPFQVIHHADRPMADWLTLWETFFNLGDGEVARKDWDGHVANYAYGNPGIELCLGLHKRREEQLQAFNSLIPELRRKYYRGNSPRINEEFTVAVHVRRGDVNAESHGYRFIRTKTILRTIESVRSVLFANAVRHRVCIYSQSVGADFEELAFPGIEFFIDSDPSWTMQELIEADVLIMDRGFFSLYAALISDGIRISYPDSEEFCERTGRFFIPSWAWRHRPQENDWLYCEADGSLDQTVFERSISTLIHSGSAPTGQVRLSDA